ncbi:MAG TPA: phosphatase PAP2 family protein [Flavisolibacter sp.]|nr:phosphatase PAP2 family protein [Flavisolibacter sp.]
MLPEPEMEESVIRNASYLKMGIPSTLFSVKSLLFAAAASLLYFAISFFLIGFKTDQLVLVAIFNFFYFASKATRRFIIGFSIFIAYWIIFDYMKAFPNYRYNDVHIASLYHMEKSFFGIHWNNVFLTPNEFFAHNTATSLDILSGIFYLCWVPVPLAFAAAMFFRNRTAFFQFSLTFLLVNLLGFAGYYLYPAAPPWYVAQYGFSFHPGTPGNTAGLARFDNFFGISVFKGIYAKSSNVFAAMPSLHAAYMMIVLFYGVKFRLGFWNILFAIIMLGIWFSAIYSGHHYVLDILAGILCAVLGIIVFQVWLKTTTGGKFMETLHFLTAE